MTTSLDTHSWKVERRQPKRRRSAPPLTVCVVADAVAAGQFERLYDRYTAWLATHLGISVRTTQPHAEAERENLGHHYRAPGGRLVARLGEDPVGVVALRSLDPATAELARCFVVPEHQGAGAGRRLVTAAVDLAAAGGHRRVRLDTLPAAMPAAVALYAALGFRPIGTRRVDGLPFEVQTMGLELAGAHRTSWPAARSAAVAASSRSERTST